MKKDLSGWFGRSPAAGVSAEPGTRQLHLGPAAAAGRCQDFPLHHRGRDSPSFGYNYWVADLGKLLIIVGAVIVCVGAVLALAGRTQLPLGRLPGDILYRGKNTTFYFPLATSILLSVVLSALLYVISRSRH